MSLIDSLGDHADKAVDLGEEYILKTQEYYELKVFKQLSSTTNIFTKIAVFGSLISLGLLLLLVAATIALGDALGNIVYACLINAACLFILAFILYLMRAKIETLIVKTMSKQFFN